MFSKQLEYSYLMYEYIKNSPREYILGEEIIVKTNVPKGWGTELLYSMVKNNLLVTIRGKGFCCIQQELDFWEFYLRIEEFKLSSKEFLNKNPTFREIEYMTILKKIVFKTQKEMKKIKM